MSEGPMQFRSYDSFEQMQADLKRAHDEAVAAMTPTQRSIALGGYACAINAPDVGPSYGAIQSVAECRAWHELYCGIGDVEANLAVLAKRGWFRPPSRLPEPEEKPWEGDGFASAADFVDYYIAQHMDSYREGYLHGWWFSKWEPSGELDSGHASICVPITEEVYLDAYAHGGALSNEHAEQVLATVRRVRAEGEEMRKEKEGDG